MWGVARNQYNCSACEGTGSIEHCSECNIEAECVKCRGSGVDPVKVDLDKFFAAEEEMFKKHGGRSFNLYSPNDRKLCIGLVGELGENGPDWTLRFDDFLRQNLS